MKRLLATLVLCLLPALARADITSNLELHWKLDDGSGTSAADSSGNARTGTLVNTPTWTTGQVNGGLDLESTSTQYVERTSAPVTAIPLSLCAWVNPESFSGVRTIISVYSSTGGNESRFAIGILSDGTPRVYMTESTGVTTEGVSWGSTISTGAWSHICGTFASGTNNLKIHVGAGTPVSTTLSITPSGINRIRAGSDDESSPFDGIIDEVRVYSRALSEADIDELFAYDGTSAVKPKRQVIIVQ